MSAVSAASSELTVSTGFGTRTRGRSAGPAEGTVTGIDELRDRLARIQHEGPNQSSSPGEEDGSGGSRGAGTAVEKIPDYDAMARSICLRLLTGSARTRADLAAALARKGIPETVAERVLDRYTEVGLIDDGAYAQAYVRTKHRERGLGRRGLAVELKRKGVGEEEASVALAIIEPEDERARGQQLVARRISSALAAGPDAARRRLLNLLARRGYPADMSYEIVDAALRAAGVEDDGELAGGASD